MKNLNLTPENILDANEKSLVRGGLELGAELELSLDLSVIDDVLSNGIIDPPKRPRASTGVGVGFNSTRSNK